MLVVFVVCLSLFMITLVEFEIQNWYVDFYLNLWLFVSIGINLLFLIELLLYFFAFKNFKWMMINRRSLVFEILLQTVSTIAAVQLIDFSFYKKLVAMRMICIVFLLRSIRLVSFFTEIKQWNLILRTFKYFSAPFLNMVISMYIVYFYFAWLGQLLFENKVTTQSSQT